MFGGASERVPTVMVPGAIRPRSSTLIWSMGVTASVVYLSSETWSLPARASVDLGVLVASVPPPQAAREKASATATGTVVSHFRADFFIKHSLSLQVPSPTERRGREET